MDFFAADTQPFLFTSHPDKDGIMSLLRYQDQPLVIDGQQAYSGTTPLTSETYTYALYMMWGSNRGNLDVNSGHLDNSVHLNRDISGVIIGGGGGTPVASDSRVVPIPAFSTGNTPQVGVQAPDIVGN